VLILKCIESAKEAWYIKLLDLYNIVKAMQAEEISMIKKL
jgi:hypothetical protein